MNSIPADSLRAILATITAEILAAIRAGQNWKVIINGGASSEITYIVEKHGKAVSKTR